MIMVGLDIYIDEYSDAYKPAFKIIKLKNRMTPELSFLWGLHGYVVQEINLSRVINTVFLHYLFLIADV